MAGAQLPRDISNIAVARYCCHGPVQLATSNHSLITEVSFTRVFALLCGEVIASILYYDPPTSKRLWIWRVLSRARLDFRKIRQAMPICCPHLLFPTSVPLSIYSPSIHPILGSHLSGLLCLLESNYLCNLFLCINCRAISPVYSHSSSSEEGGVASLKDRRY